MLFPPMKTQTMLAATLWALAVGPGCAGAPPPTERLTTAEAAIREAELDMRTGKLSEADWRAQDRALRAEAVEILRRLDDV